MTIRTSKKTATFTKPFVLGGYDEMLPAGAYSVETDEELLEGLSFLAYRRILTRIRLHAQPGHPGLTQMLTIDPNELDAALKRDQAPAEMAATVTSQMTLERATETCWEEVDCQAIDRAEDEGMIARPR